MRRALVALGARTLVPLAVVVFLLAWPPLAGAAMEWLAKSSPPAPAQAIVVVGGGARERLETAARLHAGGFAPRILVTGSGRFIASARSILSDLGVPGTAVIQPPDETHSTWEDALLIRRVVEQQGFRSILVVTSPYHCRRLGLMLDRCLEGTGVNVTITASASLYFDPPRWWADGDGWVLIPAEYGKLLWWLVAGPPEVTGTP
jgi:uncharacterized SAM-binding protein YcdF (DUF218 family)